MMMMMMLGRLLMGADIYLLRSKEVYSTALS